MRVTVVGAGYVGLVSGAGLAAVGHQVCCVDVDPAKVAAIGRGASPVHEVGLPEQLARVAGRDLTATTDLAAAVRASDLTIIAVGTPFDGQRIDLTQVEDAARQIGAALADHDEYHVVVVKSTVVPGTTAGLVRSALEAASGRRVGIDIGLAMNPEFLREGSAVDDFARPDRIVIGALDDESAERVAELYKPFQPVDVVHTDLGTAEMIKYAANSLLATLISFSNEIANLCAATGVDAGEVMRGVHLDARLNPQLPDGTRVSPGVLSYLASGCGFGGSCFPKDVRALVAFGRGHELPMTLLDGVMAVNDAQPLEMLRLLGRHHTVLAGLRIAVLGTAFKPDTDDVRESPAFVVVDELLRRGAEVVVHDPVAIEPTRARLGERVRYATSLAEAVDGVDVVMLTTSWSSFRALPDLLAPLDAPPLVVDGRRMFRSAHFARYEAIGGATAAP